MIEGGVSGESQVSERVRMSRLESETKSRRTVGLSRLGVTVVADLMLRWEMLREEGVGGPGLSWMSPESKRRRQVRKIERLGGRRAGVVLDGKRK